MKGRRKAATVELLAVGALALAGQAAGDVPSKYSVTVVRGPFCSKYPVVVPRAISEEGHVVGYYSPCVFGLDQAFVWTGGPEISPLEFPPGTSESRALAIDSEGNIAGWYQQEGDNLGYLGFVLNGSGFTTIYPPAGGNWVELYGVRGETAVGFWGNTGQGPGAVASRWDAGVLSILSGLRGGTNVAIGIDSRGRIGIRPGIATFMEHGFLWDAGRVIDLAVIPTGQSSNPIAISGNGTIAGFGFIPQAKGFPIKHGFRWRDGEMDLLPPLPGDLECIGFGVNDDGFVVGQSGQNHAVIWYGNEPVDPDSLAPLGVDTRLAWAINNKGQIAAQGYFEGERALLILNPIYTITDLNGDGATGPGDLAILLASWGPSRTSPADFNHDGAVGPADLAQLLAHWGQ